MIKRERLDWNRKWHELEDNRDNSRKWYVNDGRLRRRWWQWWCRRRWLPMMTIIKQIQIHVCYKADKIKLDIKIMRSRISIIYRLTRILGRCVFAVDSQVPVPWHRGRCHTPPTVCPRDIVHSPQSCPPGHRTSIQWLSRNSKTSMIITLHFIRDMCTLYKNSSCIFWKVSL